MRTSGLTIVVGLVTVELCVRLVEVEVEYTGCTLFFRVGVSCTTGAFFCNAAGLMSDELCDGLGVITIDVGRPVLMDVGMVATMLVKLTTVVGCAVGVCFCNETVDVAARVECIICAVVISDGLDVDGSEAVRPSDVVEF